MSRNGGAEDAGKGTVISTRPGFALVSGTHMHNPHRARSRARRCQGGSVQDSGEAGHKALVRPDAGHAAGNLKGILAMVAATALFTCGDSTMKIMSANLPTGETVFVRSVFSVITITAF